MENLKSRIIKNHPDKVKKYGVSWDPSQKCLKGMDLFARMLVDDIKNMLLEEWGEAELLSEFDRQEKQYMYAMESDNYLNCTQSRAIQLPQQMVNRLFDSSWMTDKQNCCLIAKEEYNLNRLTAALAGRYQEMGYTVIFYDCGQSLLSGSLENLLDFLTDRLDKLAAALEFTDEKTEGKSAEDRSLEEKIIGFHESIKKYDEYIKENSRERNTKTVLVIRGLDRLNDRELFHWLPLQKYQNVRFLLSCCSSPVGPEKYREMTETVFFQDAVIFERSSWADIYMKKCHKELDAELKRTLLEKAEGKEEQYMELLMQRLLILNHKDYAQIKQNGDGMQAISSYLCNLINRQPDSLEEIVSLQFRLVEDEVGKEFSDAMTCILCALPYSIPLGHIENIMKRQGIEFSQLKLTLYKRMLGFLVNETLDGHLGMIPSPASEKLYSLNEAGILRWSRIICDYMTELPADDFFKTQYLFIAYVTGFDKGLKYYLEKVDKDRYFIVLMLEKVLERPGGTEWLADNICELEIEDTAWCLKELYNSMKTAGLISRNLLSVWERLLGRLAEEYRSCISHRNNELKFMCTYQCGEMAHILNLECAVKYLENAKEISREDFLRWPNRIWKSMHGIPLTPEEEKMNDPMEIPADAEKGPLLAYGSEVQDALAECSYFSYIRVINQYLSVEYENAGDYRKADQLKEEVKKATQMFDPDPENHGKAEMASGVTVFSPEYFEGKEQKKRAYKPDYRRNTAIQLAKEGGSLKQKQKQEEAIVKYEESNAILKEIYDDGVTGEFYDLNGVIGNPVEVSKKIQSECLRDMALNYKGMAIAAYQLMREEQSCGYLKNMFEQGYLFDSARNSRESKADLEEYAFIAACIYFDFKKFAKCVRACSEYFKYRGEAAAKGEPLDDYIMERRNGLKSYFYNSIISAPELGKEAVSILLRESNASVVSNNFETYVDLTVLIADLADWMWEHNLSWVNGQADMEDIYTHNIHNLSMLWSKNNRWNDLKYFAERLEAQFDHISKTDNIILAAEAISQYGLYLFRNGNYSEALFYFERIVKRLEPLVPNQCMAAVLLPHYSRYLSALSESGKLQEADQAACHIERFIEKMEIAGIGRKEIENNISESSYQELISSERCQVYFNHAIVMARLGDSRKAEEYFDKAEHYALSGKVDPSQAKTILERIKFFRKNGLPGKKYEGDAEASVREIENRIQQRMKEFESRPEKSKMDFQRIAEEIGSLLEQLEQIPEKKIFCSKHYMAQLYHLVGMNYYTAENFSRSREYTARAVEYAQQCTEADSLFAEIYTNMGALCRDTSDQMMYMKKSIDVMEQLMRENKPFSENSLAMSYRNYGLLLASDGQKKEAAEYVEKAYFIWKRLYKKHPDGTLKEYIADSERLYRAITGNNIW